MPGDTLILTGSTGFIGGHLLCAALQRGYRVVVLLRRSSDGSRLASLRCRWNDRLSVFVQGEGNPPRDTLEGGTLLHLASLVGPGYGARDYVGANVDYLRGVLDMCLEGGVRRVVYAGSLLVGCDDCVPIRNPYLESKRAAEELLLGSVPRGVTLSILRLGWTYGPGDRRRLRLFRMIERGVCLLPVPTARLQPLFVTDAVEAFLAAAGVDSPLPRVLPLVGAETVDARELLSLVAFRMGVRLKFVEVPSWWLLRAAGVVDRLFERVEASRRLEMFSRDAVADAGLTKAVLGWEPAVGLDEGMELTVRWYREIRRSGE